MVKSIECAVRGPEFRFQAYQLLVVAFLVSQMVKILPAVQESWILSMGWEDPLEMGMATHSSILALRLLWIEEIDQLQSMGLQRVRHD